jgi:hypothetical protein
MERREENIYRKDCSDIKLAQYYARTGYSAVQRVTMLETQLWVLESRLIHFQLRYKPGFCVRYSHWKIDQKYLNLSASEIPILFAVHATPQYFKYLEEQVGKQFSFNKLFVSSLKHGMG